MQDLTYLHLDEALTSASFLSQLSLFQRAWGTRVQDQDKVHIFAPALAELGLDEISEAEHDTRLTSGITQRCLFDALSIRGADVPPRPTYHDLT